MKSLLLSVIALLVTSISYSQVSIRIDSVDISRIEKIVFDNGGVVCGNPTFPRVQIIATIENQTSKDVYIHNGEIFTIRYHLMGAPFHQGLEWLCYQRIQPGLDMSGIDDGGLTVSPGASRKMVFILLPPENSKKENTSRKHQETFPLDWYWEKDEVTDADYLKWLKRILPSMRIFVIYGVNPYDANNLLVSDPVDLERVVVTSSLDKESD